MKKLACVLTIAATLLSNNAHAQMNSKSMGGGAQAGSYSGGDNFAWGIGLGALAVIGVVVGVTAGYASSNGSNFSH
jgi:hypothetical protein